ncbi:hypothetical protein B0O99DRAFT_722115 [Bisporella sp. PMI_857]|nr:hypothetical protein B0O99DRAFT_722115 [Bisporella sp. PMI_857]
MSSINYTVDASTIGEWTLRREGPNFEDFPGPVRPFGVEAGPPPPPSTPSPATTPRKSRPALSALSSNLLLSPSLSKENFPSSFSSFPSADASGTRAERIFAGVWGDFVPFREMNNEEWEEEKKRGVDAVLADIIVREEEAIRERKRKNNERGKARYNAKKAEKKKAEEEEEEKEGKRKGKKVKRVEEMGKGNGKGKRKREGKKISPMTSAILIMFEDYLCLIE